jgi:hypothetical protein
MRMSEIERQRSDSRPSAIGQDPSPAMSPRFNLGMKPAASKCVSALPLVEQRGERCIKTGTKSTRARRGAQRGTPSEA